jgi:hypothetical protein
MIRHVSLLLLGLVGCAFDEDLPEVDIAGTVVIPRAAATRTFIDDKGVETEVTDIRFLGPVYLGAYPSVGPYFDYPHPEMGPIVDPSRPGDTYPYGGTTVGRFDFACLEDTACRIVTGRFTSFQQIIDYFRDYVKEPLANEFGVEVTDEEYYEQYCFDYFYDTSYTELAFLAVEENGGLDFTENDDGDFVGQFDMKAVTWMEGMQLWGWIDNPSNDFTFATCDPNLYGQARYEYSQTSASFQAGGGYYDVLNFPSLYISDEDWVVGTPFTMSTKDEEPELKLDFVVGQ